MQGKVLGQLLVEPAIIFLPTFISLLSTVSSRTVEEDAFNKCKMHDNMYLAHETTYFLYPAFLMVCCIVRRKTSSIDNDFNVINFSRDYIMKSIDILNLRFIWYKIQSRCKVTICWKVSYLHREKQIPTAAPRGFCICCLMGMTFLQEIKDAKPVKKNFQSVKSPQYRANYHHILAFSLSLSLFPFSLTFARNKKQKNTSARNMYALM